MPTIDEVIEAAMFFDGVLTTEDIHEMEDLWEHLESDPEN